MSDLVSILESMEVANSKNIATFIFLKLVATHTYDTLKFRSIFYKGI